jgi:hypothetical protein
MSASIFGKRAADAPLQQNGESRAWREKTVAEYLRSCSGGGGSIFGKRDQLESSVGGGGGGMDHGESTGSPSEKRTRQLDVATQQHVDPIFRRVVLWLFENQAHLPKTTTALRNAIKPQCSRYVDVDPLVILYHLLFNGVLTLKLVGGHEMIQLGAGPFKPVDQLIGVVPRTDTAGAMMSGAFSDDFQVALRRAVHWATQHSDLAAGRCFRKPALLRQLGDVCRIRRQVDPSAIIQAAARRGLLRINPSSERLSYHIMERGFLDVVGGMCHYASWS